MKTLASPRISWDVDETLILHHKKSDDMVKVEHAGFTSNLAVHRAHVDLLVEYKKKGWCVEVWSAAGAEWATAVVKALDITKFVDVVGPKPSIYVDDLPAAVWLGYPKYIDS